MQIEMSVLGVHTQTPDTQVAVSFTAQEQVVSSTHSALHHAQVSHLTHCAAVHWYFNHIRA